MFQSFSFFLTISLIFPLVWSLWLWYIFLFTGNSNSKYPAANLELEWELLGHWDNFSLFSRSQVSSPQFSQMPQPIMTWIPQWIPRKNATLLDWPHCWDCLAKRLLEHLFFSFWENSTIRSFKIICYYSSFSYNFKSLFCFLYNIILATFHQFFSFSFFFFWRTEGMASLRQWRVLWIQDSHPFLIDQWTLGHSSPTWGFWLQNLGHQY